MSRLPNIGVRSPSEPLVTWRLDHLVRAASWCAIAAWALPFATGAVLAQVSDTSNLFGAFAVATIIMAIGAATGVAPVMGFGCLAFGLITAVGLDSPWALAATGCVLLIAVVFFDLSIAFRRSPDIDRSVWIGTAATTAVVLAAAIGGFAMAYSIAVGATWDAVLIPLALVAIGLTARYVADRHTRHFRSIRLKHQR